jgi:hypothetical protein
VCSAAQIEKALTKFILSILPEEATCKDSLFIFILFDFFIDLSKGLASQWQGLIEFEDMDL